MTGECSRDRRYVEIATAKVHWKSIERPAQRELHGLWEVRRVDDIDAVETIRHTATAAWAVPVPGTEKSKSSIVGLNAQAWTCFKSETCDGESQGARCAPFYFGDL